MVRLLCLVSLIFNTVVFLSLVVRIRADRTWTCPYGWTRIPQDLKCVRLFQDRENWEDARRACQTKGADLVTIRSESENEFIKKFEIQGVAWIGLRSFGQNVRKMKYHWLDDNNDGHGSLHNVLRVPSTLSKNCSCFMVSTSNNWEANKCTQLEPYICEHPGYHKIIQPCPDGWNQHGDRCFHANDKYKMSRHQAKTYCESLHARLVIIPDFDTQSVLEKEIIGKFQGYFWIGLQGVNESFQWSENSVPFTYSKWHKGQPRKEWKCVSMGNFSSDSNPTVNWKTENCRNRLPPICEMIPTKKSLKCDKGWSFYEKNKICVKKFYNKRTWKGARSVCNAHDGDLLTILDSRFNVYLGKLHGKTNSRCFWIGVHVSKDESMHVLSDKDQFSEYAHLLKGSLTPTHKAACICMCGKNTTYRQKNCSNKLSFICQRNPAKSVEFHKENKIAKRDVTSLKTNDYHMNSNEECDKGGEGYLGTCYVNYETMKNYSDAQETCKSLDGNLVTIKDRFVQAFLIFTMVSSRYWVGLNNILPSKMWDSTTYPYVWLSGDKVHFTNWDLDHQNEKIKKCVGINKDNGFVGLWHSYSCSIEMPFICEYPRPGFTTGAPSTMSVTPPLLPCPDDWVGIGNMCFRAYLTSSPFEEKNWIEAKSYCESLVTNGTLASMTSSDISSELKQLINLKYSSNIRLWIGLNDRDSEGVYKWTDNQPLNYTNWAPGEPRNFLGSEDCVIWSVMSNNWDDYNCYDTLGYICQAPRGGVTYTTVSKPTVAPTVAALCGDDSWTVFQGHCYRLSSTQNANERKTWFESRDACRTEGADLVSIRNHEENEFIASLINRMEAIHGFHKNYFWIGLNILDGDVYKWTDGSPAFFFSWLPGQPDDGNGGERCVRLKFIGAWTDKSCHSALPYICKKITGNFSPMSLTETVPPAGGCPDQFFGVPGTTRCFHVGGLGLADRKSFQDAGDACKAVRPNSRLASIHSSLDEQFVTTLVSELKVPAWIGLKAKYYWRVHQEDFVWVDNTRKDYVHWGPSQPIETSKGGKCVDLIIKPKAAGDWANVDCNEKLAYICEYRKDITFPHNKPNTTGCSNGYQRYRNSCYKYISTPKTWKESEEKCVQDGGHLACIQGRYEIAFIEVMTYSQHIRDDLWIGLSKKSGQNTYIWTDGWPVVYTSWDTDQPNSSDSKSCVSHRLGSAWSTKSCSMTLPFVCEIKKDSSPAPTAIVPGKCPNEKWTQFGENCYYVEADDLKSWPGANFACDIMGSDLVSIHDSDEQKFVASLAATERADTWIGLHITGSGGFRWSDDSEAEYFSWDSDSSPDGNPVESQACVLAQWVNGAWTVIDCFKKLGYVCKMKQIPIAQMATPKIERKRGVSPGEVAGIAVGGIVFVSIFFIIAFLVIRIISKGQRNSPRRFDNPMQDISSLPDSRSIQ